MIPRTALPVARRLARAFPVLFVTGPRQSGKTTLARLAFPRKAYVSLEDLDRRAFAATDPRGFLAALPHGAVIDEVQRAPELLSYIQTEVDGRRQLGRYVLTGSQNLLLTANVSQTLAGRAAWLRLMPLDLAEIGRSGRPAATLDDLLFRGGYPALYDRAVEPNAWHAAYVASYVERDVRQLAALQDLAAFQRFLRLCAARTGQLLNLSALAGDVGVAHTTVRHWLSVLEASYVVFLLPPHHENFGKRVMKTPKLYFWDTGLAAHLLGIRKARELAAHFARPALFETWAVAELAKQALNRGEDPRLFFWRDNVGTEVDVVADRGGRLEPTEIKSGQTVATDAFRNLALFGKYAGDRSHASRLVYGGEESYVRAGVRVTAWRDLGGGPGKRRSAGDTRG
jgi:hypothetical protein